MQMASSRKRQKASQNETEAIVFDKNIDLSNNSKKDAEEKRLENLLFGANHLLDEDLTVLGGGDGSEDMSERAGAALENLTDADLFFVDDGVPFDPVSEPASSASESEEDEENRAGPSQPQKPIPAYAKKTTTRKAAWSDPSDEPIKVSIESGRARKLRDAQGETTLSGREYEYRLRRQYESMHPQPEWAKKARHQKRRRESDVSDEEEDIFTSTSGILAKKKRDSKIVAQGSLAIERLRDANQVSQTSDAGAIRTLAFHPSNQVPVLSIGSADRRIRLFNIDGHTNPLLQTIHIPSLPVSTAIFHPSGSQLIMTGNRPFYHTYDLNSGVTQQSTRGLWGTTFSSSSQGDPIQTISFSQTGSVLAVAGRSGYVHLVDWKTGGASGQVVTSLKTGSGENVKSLCWTADDKLIGLTNEAEVYLWDVGIKKCIKRWRDEGGYRGTGRVMDASHRGGGWIGIGSTSGFVNVYGSDSLTDTNEKPKLIKSVANLTTPISTVKFNKDAQLMAIASGEKKDAMRLIHLPSLTSFSNWPSSGTPLGRVSDVEFSPEGGYMAIGNTRGKVLLYHLMDY